MTQDVYPTNEEAFWHMNLDEVQGVANDGENWIITTAQLLPFGSGVFTSWPHNDGTLWKIPLGTDLGANSIPSGVSQISATDIPELYNLDYFHFGDPDTYTHDDGITYILVPTYNNLEDPNINKGAIAIFRASDLAYLNYAEVFNEEPGFCFVDAFGHIYIKGSSTSLRKFIPDWDQLIDPADSEHDGLQDECSEVIQLDLSGSGEVELHHLGGGEISDDGLSLALVSGKATNQQSSDGVHLFSINSYDCGSSWNWEKSSYNVDSPEFAFTYLYESSGQNPQGVTFWDIDSPSVDEEVRGKMHVMLFDFEYPLGNNIYFYHFSDFIHVNGIVGLEEGDFERRVGGIEKPFKYFNDAFFHYPAWNGSTIVLQAGSYNETGYYNECVKLTSEGGAAVIGQ